MKKIAVVEDNPDNRLLVKVILEPLYEVAEFDNGSSALESLQAHKPDLLLLDISLPEMDGMEVLRRIRANPDLRDLPVIALTAHAMAGDREKYIGLGFDDYVTKPIVDETILLRAIERRLGSGPAPDRTAPSPGAMDAGALARLNKLGGPSFAAEMIGVFLEYTSQKIAQGRQAWEAGNLPGLKDAMHPIKSSAGNVGATRVQELAARIEELAKNGQAEPAAGLLSDLERTFGIVKIEFEQIQKNLLTS